MRALKQVFPGVQFVGVGGPLMCSEGLKSLFPMEDLTVIVIMEVLPKQPKLASMFEALQQQCGSGSYAPGSNEIVEDPEHFEQPCIHGELSKDLCSICGTSPDAMRRTVYVTSGGMRYHYVFACRALEAGQSAIENRGGARSQVQSTYEDVVKYSREPCSVCVR